VEIVLDYYDKAYTYDLTKKIKENIFLLPLESADASENAASIDTFYKANQPI